MHCIATYYREDQGTYKWNIGNLLLECPEKYLYQAIQISLRLKLQFLSNANEIFSQVLRAMPLEQRPGLTLLG